MGKRENLGYGPALHFSSSFFFLSILSFISSLSLSVYLLFLLACFSGDSNYMPSASYDLKKKNCYGMIIFSLDLSEWERTCLFRGLCSWKMAEYSRYRYMTSHKNLATTYCMTFIELPCSYNEVRLGRSGLQSQITKGAISEWPFLRPYHGD